MQLNIQNVTPETAEVQGQTVTRAFAEGVMLSGLIAGAGKNDAKQGAIIEQYLTAGLDTSAFPEATSKVLRARAAAERHRQQQIAESQRHAERFAPYSMPSELEVARRRAKREALEAKMRAQGAAIRAANGRSTWSSWD